MTGNKLIVELLAQHDIDFIFGALNDQDTNTSEELRRSKKIRYLSAETGQGAGLMAEGYARSTGKIGVCITSAGQAALSAVSGVATAYVDSMALLLITVREPAKGVPPGDNQETQSADRDYIDLLNLFKPITRWNTRIDRPEEVSRTVVRAFEVMAKGRPSPIHLDIAAEILQAELMKPTLLKATPIRRIPAAQRLNQLAAEVLVNAKYPLIIAGGGIVSAQGELELAQLAELLNAPIMVTPMSKGVVPPDHPLYAGGIGQPFASYMERPIPPYVDKADVILSVGCSLSQRTTGDWDRLPTKSIIQVDIDEKQIGKNYPVRVGIIADAKIALQQLIQTVEASEENGKSQWTNIERQSYLPKHIRETDRKMVQIFQNLFDAQTIIAAEGSRLVDLLLSDFDVALPRHFLHACDLGIVGYALPASLGAKCAHPDSPVVAVTDTAGLFASGIELTTAVEYGLKILTLTITDRERDKSPDIVKFAESLGIYGCRVDKISQLESVLRTAQATDQPTVVHICLS